MPGLPTGPPVRAKKQGIRGAIKQRPHDCGGKGFGFRTTVRRLHDHCLEFAQKGTAPYGLSKATIKLRIPRPPHPPPGATYGFCRPTG